MQPEDSILKDNFIECLRLSDRAIVTSFAILFVGAITATNGTPGHSIALPIGSLSVKSLETALWIILALHFVNGLRYVFLLYRAKSIAKRLGKNVLNAARHFPAVATSNIMTESFVTVILTLLSTPITDRLLISGAWANFLMAFLVSSPFILAAVATRLELNAT
jgi:hypothetical protein